MADTNIIKDLNALDPKMLPRAKAFLTKCAQAGIKLAVTETRRTVERQQWLYAQGRTRPGQIVTWTMQSQHILGLAIDVVFVTNDGSLTYVGNWNQLQPIAESCGLTWGGTWSTPDKPHFQFNPNYTMPNDVQQPSNAQTPVVPLNVAQPAEDWFIAQGYVQNKKDLNAPLTRGEFYVILQRILQKNN